jgi:hypothetical protein
LGYLQLIGVIEARIRREKFQLCSVIDRAEFLLRPYGPSSGMASETVLQSLYHTRTNLYFYLLKFDTDYKDAYLRIGDCVKSHLDGFEVGVRVPLENKLSELEISRSQNRRKVHPSRLV